MAWSISRTRLSLVEVDVVALQTAQTGFDFALDARGCEVFSPSSLLVGECAALRKDVDPVALALQGFAYDLLGSSPAIKGGCINPVDAKIELTVDSADSFALIFGSPIDAPTGIGADGSGADTYAGNLKSALAESAGFELHVFASKGGKGADKNWGLAARDQGGGMACRAGASPAPTIYGCAFPGFRMCHGGTSPCLLVEPRWNKGVDYSRVYLTDHDAAPDNRPEIELFFRTGTVSRCVSGGLGCLSSTFQNRIAPNGLDEASFFVYTSAVQKSHVHRRALIERMTTWIA